MNLSSCGWWRLPSGKNPEQVHEAGVQERRGYQLPDTAMLKNVARAGGEPLIEQARLHEPSCPSKKIATLAMMIARQTGTGA